MAGNASCAHPLFLAATPAPACHVGQGDIYIYIYDIYIYIFFTYIIAVYTYINTYCGSYIGRTSRAHSFFSAAISAPARHLCKGDIFIYMYIYICYYI